MTRDPKYADVPSVTITGYAGFGTGGTRPFYKTQNNFELVDNLMYHHGDHDIKMGVNLLRRQAQQLVPYSKKGIFAFAGNFTGSYLSDFLLGLPSQTRIGLSPYITEADLRTLDVYGYVQDDWRISSRLTLNFGLRWEDVGPPADLHGLTININPFTGLQPPTLVPGQKLFNSDYDNFAPRFGFALRPFGGTRTVVRGGYGVFYNANNYDEYFYMPYNPPFGNLLTYQSLPNTPTLSLDNPFPASGGQVGVPTAYGIDPKFRVGYVQFFTFGVQHEITRDTILQVSFVGSKSTHLAKGYDLNYAPPGPGAVASRRVLTPNLANDYVEMPSSNATYDSLQVQLERRFSKGLMLLTSYAFAKALDDVANSQGDKGTAQMQNPLCANSCEKGDPAYDRRQRFTFNLVYQLPAGKGRRFLNHGGIADAFLGGWEVGSIFQRQSGQPLTVAISGDPLNIGTSGNARAQYLGGSIKLNNPTLNKYFNTAVFAAPTPYTPGNLGRGTFTGPGLQTLDFALYKTFNLKERHRLQVAGSFLICRTK